MLIPFFAGMTKVHADLYCVKWSEAVEPSSKTLLNLNGYCAVLTKCKELLLCMFRFTWPIACVFVLLFAGW